MQTSQWHPLQARTLQWELQAVLELQWPATPQVPWLQFHPGLSLNLRKSNQQEQPPKLLRTRISSVPSVERQTFNPESNAFSAPSLCTNLHSNVPMAQHAPRASTPEKNLLPLIPHREGVVVAAGAPALAEGALRKALT